VGRQQRPVPPPLEGDDRLITAVITAGFLVALIVLLIVRDQLSPVDRWWVWVAALGTVMGLFGFVYVPYLKRRRSRAAERRQAAQDRNRQADMDRSTAAGGRDRD
jgi:type VI protein secretion system component VasK